MSRLANRSVKVQHCDNGHYCCQQSKLNESLSRSIAIQKEQITRLQKEKKFLEEVNFTLMRDFDKKVQASLEQQQKESLKQLTEMQVGYEKRLKELQQRLENVQSTYEAKLKEETAELHRGLAQSEKLAKQTLAEKVAVEEKLEELTVLCKEQDEEIKHIKLSQQSQQANVQLMREEVDKMEREKTSLLMKIEGYSLALKGLEQKYSQLSDRLVVEQTQRKQAMIGVASKQSILRSLQNQMSQQGAIRDRLLHENKALQNIVNSLDSHIFDLRKHEYGMMKQLQDVHQLAAHKQQALSGMKRDLHTLKMSV